LLYSQILTKWKLTYAITDDMESESRHRERFWFEPMRNGNGSFAFIGLC